MSDRLHSWYLDTIETMTEQFVQRLIETGVHGMFGFQDLYDWFIAWVGTHDEFPTPPPASRQVRAPATLTHWMTPRRFASALLRAGVPRHHTNGTTEYTILPPGARMIVRRNYPDDGRQLVYDIVYPEGYEGRKALTVTARRSTL